MTTQLFAEPHSSGGLRLLFWFDPLPVSPDVLKRTLQSNRLLVESLSHTRYDCQYMDRFTYEMCSNLRWRPP